MPVNLIVKIMPISEKRFLSKTQTSKKSRTKKLIMKFYGIVYYYFKFYCKCEALRPCRSFYHKSYFTERMSLIL